MADVVVRGVRHHVQRLGAGERVVVFLHGLIMDNLSSWYFTVANAAAQSASVILYDLRGHGLSERPQTGYSVTELTQDLAALLDALEVERPVQIVGNSFGGLLGLSFVVAHPERVADLVLVDAHLGDEGWGGEMAATLELEGGERDEMIARSFETWLGRHSARKRNRLARVAEALVKETSIVADLRGSPPLDDGDLSRIRCPILAFYGESSDLRDRGEALARRLPRCELRVLPGCTHSVLWEETSRLREEIALWLRRGD